MSFRQKLLDAQRSQRSWLCVGLDPDPAQIPGIPGLTTAAFCRAIVEATHDLVCAYKPNLAFFLAGGSAGVRALEEVLTAIPPHIPVVLDAKLGDIGSTQRMYGRAVFETFGVDALTVSPYVGDDAVRPLLEAYPGCGLYVLARTSNPGSDRFQAAGSKPWLAERVVEAARGWAEANPQSTVGLVVGATYPAELAAIRAAAPGLPFLIPGVGAQGGSLEDAVRYGTAADGIGPLINVSRAVLYAGSGVDYADRAREAAVQWWQAINWQRDGQAAP